MSRLRPHLQSARRAYYRARYPGDLASDVLGPDLPSRRNGWVRPVGFGGGALAAAVALGVMLSRPAARPSPPPGQGPISPPARPVPAVVARVTAQEAGPSTGSMTPPAMPEVPAM